MSLRLQAIQPSDPSYRIISLTKGQFTAVDADIYEELNQHKWCACWMPSSQSFYVARASPRDPITRKQTLITMSRVIMNAPKGMLVDHWDHATLNNRRYNLRLVTYSQNGMNRRILKGNSSGFKGVTWHQGEKKYRVQIKVEGKAIALGNFRADQLFDATEAYRLASIKYHGEFGFVQPESVTR